MPAPTGNIVAGNFVGTDALGTIAVANGVHGVEVRFGAKNNLIGTDSDGVADAAERNVISGNALDGVSLYGAGTEQNIVAGNYAGTDVTGRNALGNGGPGVSINAGAARNLIGTNGDGAHDDAERNIISGNASYGVVISASGTDNNTVAGNNIGTDVTGTAALGNGANGVLIQTGAQSNLIGTNGDGVADAAERNVISGNQLHGVEIVSSGSDQNVVAGNFIGTDVTGLADLGNQFDGILIWQGAQSNRIGTNGDGIADTDERNIISGNDRHGVDIGRTSYDPTTSSPGTISAPM